MWEDEKLQGFFIVSQVVFVLFWTLTSKPYIKQQKIGLAKKLGFVLMMNLWFLVCVFQLVINPVKIPNAGTIVMYPGLFVYTVGLVIAVAGKVKLGKNWGIPIFHNPDQKTLETSGIYNFSRNPIYLGEMLMIVGFELAIPSYLLLLLPLEFGLNYWRAKKEEKVLESVFGKEFAEYKARVRLFM
jgi:protein-S-isoprenylcysteine O-methyltransferase Ste14